MAARCREQVGILLKSPGSVARSRRATNHCPLPRFQNRPNRCPNRQKQALLEKLAEKRTALISHAVTKGLDPSASMKDSGSAWLGQIPAHWRRMVLARVIYKFEQGWSPSCDEREASMDEWGVLKSGCVNYGVFQEREHKTLPSGIDPIPSLEVKVGDILMCRASGSKHLIGSVALVRKCRAKLIFQIKLIG